MNIIPGTDIGRYHILEQLGEGGMAVVYKAYDTQLERDVALKVLRSGQGSNEKFIKRFKLEARALAKLNHPNIVKILDYGEQDGLPYLVMEYVQGKTLKQKVGKPMDYREAAAILAPIADALAYAHEHKILHRDVKPSNILIKEDGTPLLSDFGIAKILELDETLDLTGTGMGMGTPEYMAPELGLGETGDEKADQYALGIIFYELITGRKPFRADTPLAVLRKHTDEPLPRPRQYNPDLPDNVERVLFKMLAKRPQDRFESISALSNALKQLAQGEKVAGVGRVMPQKNKQNIAILGIGAVAVIIFLFSFLMRGGSMNSTIDLEKAATLQNQATAVAFSTISSFYQTQFALIPSPINWLTATFTPTVNNLSLSPTPFTTNLKYSYPSNCTPGGNYIDKEGDVRLDYVDILKVETKLENTLLTVTFFMKNLPSEITINNTYVEQGREEYYWGVGINTDHNTSTGGGSASSRFNKPGIDYEIALSNYVNGQPQTGPIEKLISADLRSSNDQTQLYLHPAELKIDYKNNSITLASDVPGITKDSFLYFATNVESSIHDSLCN